MSFENNNFENYTDKNYYNQIQQIGLQISKIGLWDWNTITNKVFYSENSIKILGYKGHEFDNKPEEWDKHVHPDDQNIYFETFDRHINGELESYESVYRILCKDGQYKWVLDKGKVIERDKNSKPLRIVGTHIDITKQKHTENLLKNNLHIIANQNKRLHNFTHIVSHNLKNHVFNLEDLLNFYEESTDVNEKKELFSHLKSISKSLNGTMADLDNIISIRSKSNFEELFKNVNLFQCVEAITESLKLDRFKSQVSLENRIDKNTMLFTNSSYIESIFHNLISNGIKYSKQVSNSQVIITSKETEKDIKIIVSDNGIGIDLEKFKDQLFKMYRTFHGTQREDSRGVGLYITKTQVEALNGSIEVESKLAIGTTFTVTFDKTKKPSN
ncbi:MAG: PAS domain S-box protein [Winogradskyella sp.]|uniref:sensor histidine kinase n=1 Tax=Winogradskyella sp. TaxID=1883156 RepID=UPI000F400952|nr:PAS domain-containing sensor histidine kinase [Winogradskyella sp.]RNC87130.1 MAG: PAS domain S-box protein [Winogradskyella sp.]